MTPLDLAQNLARSADPDDRALGVAIVARGLSDDTPDRLGWDVPSALSAALQYLNVDPAIGPAAERLMPTISPALMNSRQEA